MSYWKENFRNSQKPSKKDPPAAIRVPKTPVDNAWTLMGTDGSPPPTYLDVVPRPGPTRTSARPPTLIKLFSFLLFLSFFGTAGALFPWDLFSAKLIVIFHLPFSRDGK